MKYEEKILDYLKRNGKASLKELKQLHKQHQQISYNIRRLLSEKMIRAHIEIDVGIVKSIGITEDEIFFTLINRYEYPQDILNLISKMCCKDTSKASQAFIEFINLCKEKGLEEDAARRTAHLIMSEAFPSLRAQVTLYLLPDGEFPPNWNFQIRNPNYFGRDF